MVAADPMEAEAAFTVAAVVFTAVEVDFIPAAASVVDRLAEAVSVVVPVVSVGRAASAEAPIAEQEDLDRVVTGARHAALMAGDAHSVADIEARVRSVRAAGLAAAAPAHPTRSRTEIGTRSMAAAAR